jgi:hypothetical protein
MNVSSISASDQISQINALTSNASNNTDSTPPPGIGEAAVSNVSGPGKLMSKLSQLKASDPAQFQSVVSDMAQKLKDAASQASGPAATFLTNLSSKLSDIANGGDISELRQGPGGAAAGGAQGAHHGHHHHHAGGAGSSSSSDDSSGTSVRSTLDSVFQELDSALQGTSGTSASTTTSSSTTSP